MAHNMRGDPADAWRPEYNGELVDRLLGAGAVIYGKTNCPFNSADLQTFNSIYGSTRNPGDLARSPGGLVWRVGRGTRSRACSRRVRGDIAGSLRHPAHFCGVYSHKPSHGTLTNERNRRRNTWLDNDLFTSGPLARSAEDLQLLFDVLAGPAGPAAKGWQLNLPPARATDLHNFRIGVIETSDVAPIDRDYQKAIVEFVARLEQAGAKITKSHPSFDHAEAHSAYISLLRGSAAARLTEDEFDRVVAIAKDIPASDTSYAVLLRRAQAPESPQLHQG